MRTIPAAEDAEARWQISGWETQEMHFISSRKRLFVESREAAVPILADRERVRRSEH